MDKLRKLSDFDLISKLAECVDRLEGDDYDRWLNWEEQVSYGHKLSGRQRDKLMKMVVAFHPDANSHV